MRRRISLTFLWTDEAVMLEDFQLKVSRSMLEWAREFYKAYDLELAVKPEPNVGHVALAHKFALVKSGGIQPAVDSDIEDQISKEFDKRREKITQQIEGLVRERERLTAQHDALPLLHPDRDRLHTEIIKRYDQVSKLYDDLSATYDQEKREKALRDYDTWLRLQMTDKFVLSQIGGADSVNVVFAKFKHRSPEMSMRDQRGYTIGITKTLVGFNPVLFAPGGIPRWLWPYPYILIDIQRRPPAKTLAHELVHAFGEFHPGPQKVIKNLERILGYRHPRTMLDMAIDRYLGIPTYESLFKEVEGGYFDGPENDIMNYSTKRPNPSDYILHESDRQRIFDSKLPFIVDIP